MIYKSLHMMQDEQPDKGTLQIQVSSLRQDLPISDAEIDISYTGAPDDILEQVQTNSSGQTETLELPTPPVEYSLEPNQENQPYSEYTLRISAAGYETITVAGTQMLSGQNALQNIRMRPLDQPLEPDVIVIPAHTLYGEYPPKIAEEEIKPITQTGEIVLNQVVLPEYIIVHDGTPQDTTAQNHYVRYRDYIKNVASSEIYATWPRSTIIANILAIQSFTLNRVYTEWYRNKGYNFTITSSTAFDQKWMNGRNYFTSIAEAVDEVFDNYLSRPNVKQPILTQYCDGQRVQCPNWMTQWGSKRLGEQGYEPIEIIRYFYGDTMYINFAEEVSGVPSSYPGFPLDIGSVGEDVTKIQEQLNRISDNYPLIPKIAVDGIFGERTQNAVKVFQSVFGLTQDGIVGSRTWYRIQDIYVGVTRIAELT
ncbi:MAG: peptidoglycan-binding protein [Lachnospiraceae bacterium]|nr:peptidoglycan-binding protein [Lachnospiraceae bacterium]